MLINTFHSKQSHTFTKIYKFYNRTTTRVGLMIFNDQMARKPDNLTFTSGKILFYYTSCQPSPPPQKTPPPSSPLPPFPLPYPHCPPSPLPIPHIRFCLNVHSPHLLQPTSLSRTQEWNQSPFPTKFPILSSNVFKGIIHIYNHFIYNHFYPVKCNFLRAIESKVMMKHFWKKKCLSIGSL